MVSCRRLLIGHSWGRRSFFVVCHQPKLINQNPKGNTMRYVCLFTLMLPALSARDGPAIYKERCASCHDSPQPRVPALSSIKAMSGEAIYLTLTSGAMKTRAEGLSTGQIFALLAYIAPTGGSRTAPAPTCKGDA